MGRADKLLVESFEHPWRETALRSGFKKLESRIIGGENQEIFTYGTKARLILNRDKFGTLSGLLMQKNKGNSAFDKESQLAPEFKHFGFK